jgi:hypothetical protein
VYEHRRERLLPFRAFLLRFIRHVGVATGIMFGSLLLGMFGYVHFEQLSWIDGFLNASMILGGMGPVAPLRTSAGKIFAGLYALYSGVVFLVAIGIALAPVLHRLLHRFHLADAQAGADG